MACVARLALHAPDTASVRHLRHDTTLARALRPGGWLLLEAFHPQQLQYQSGGPKDAALLYTLEQLRADFGGLLHEVLAQECTVALDEGPGHHGPAHVVRWLGCAPAHGAEADRPHDTPLPQYIPS